MRNGEGRALNGENQIKLPAPDFNQKVKVSWPAGVVEKYNDLVVGACENDCSVYSTCGLFPSATIKIKLGLALTILSSFQVDTLLRLIISATALNKTALWSLAVKTVLLNHGLSSPGIRTHHVRLICSIQEMYYVKYANFEWGIQIRIRTFSLS